MEIIETKVRLTRPQLEWLQREFFATGDHTSLIIRKLIEQAKENSNGSN